ncbi:MAG: hypothetical protein ABI895_37420 [Deltaproteobacteria bacterium]
MKVSLLCFVPAWGCGASGEGRTTTVAPARSGGSSGGSNSGAPTLAGTPASNGQAPGAPSILGEGTGLNGLDLGEPVAAMACQQTMRSFVPKTPTVFVLVDRSSSMFDANAQGTNAWNPLRSGVLQVISELQTDVFFGFSAFSGDGSGLGGNNASGMAAQSMGLEIHCPDMTVQKPALNNQPAIASLYNSLDRSPYKNTPTAAALQRAAETLWTDGIEGDKYILFVTDGEPDYCDDGNALCPPDSVVGKLQKLALGLDKDGTQRAPVQTLVFGVNSPLTTISPEVLQAFANAGAGQPVAPVRPNANQAYDANAIYDQCNGVPGWNADFTATGKPAARGQTVGDYIDPTSQLAVAGTTTVYRPDPNDQAALVEQIRAALAGIKSCSFDLEGEVKVDLTRTDLGDKAKILINGNAVPFDVANGWHMLSETTVQLEGQACASWRVPGETSIGFEFPCDVIILR